MQEHSAWRGPQEGLEQTCGDHRAVGAGPAAGQLFGNSVKSIIMEKLKGRFPSPVPRGSELGRQGQAEEAAFYQLAHALLIGNPRSYYEKDCLKKSLVKGFL